MVRSEFPSALVHFITIESFAVYACALSGIALTFNGEKNAGILAPVGLVLVRLGVITPTEKTMNQIKNDGVNCFLFAPLIAAAVLLTYSLVYIACCGCPRSFGQGSYLRATWKLEYSIFYRILVIMMSISPVVMFLWRLVSPEEDDPMTFSMWVYLFVFLRALKSLMFPPTPVHHDWSSKAFDQMVFKRSWTSMVSQTNDQFCTVLTHALFQAQYGQPMNLEKLLFNPSDVKRILQICAAAERDRVSDSAKVGLLEAGEA